LNNSNTQTINIGRMNRLEVVKQVEFGVYLDGEHLNTILLPKRYVPEGCQLGDWLDVFLYMDSEDLLIATTIKPKAQVGECAYLKVTDVNQAGAFLDWGLPKDLLVPYNEQHKPMELGRSYVVHIFRDPYTDRIVASSKLNRHLSEKNLYFRPQQEVDLLICGRSDMGYKAIINHTHLGLIFKDEAFKPLSYGQSLKGFIQDVREDQKINLSLQPPAAAGRDALSEQILEHLRRNNGSSTLTDKCSPEDIYTTFNVSKNNYRKALGKLYKERKILIEPDRITLL
jgi:uncharacterized protein